MARVCLISPAHVSNNPRLVKEAGALSAAGHTVHVICGRYYPVVDKYDEAIFASAKWTWTCVDYGVKRGRLWDKLMHKWARKYIARARSPSLSLAALANHRASWALERAARNHPADLYIGHLIPGLAAASSAAKIHSAKYGFDAEDFHSAETEAVIYDPGEAKAIRQIESSLLPGCSHFTAASPLIAEAYVRTYGTKLPQVILNVFPRSEAPLLPPKGVTADSLKQPAQLYWFSQTVGPNRGLDEMVEVLAQMKTVCDLHLRGLPTTGYEVSLANRAKAVGFSGKLVFHPIADACEMPRLAAGYALGLSLEQSTPLNRDLCLTNKIFTYALAGIPICLTPTSAQKQLLIEISEAAVGIDFSDVAGSAAILDNFISSVDRRNRAQLASWTLGSSTYNWDTVQMEFLKSVTNALVD